MVTKIRLKRFGKKRNPFYRVVVTDSRKARNGKPIEEIGLYHPTREPAVIEIDSDRAQYWLGVGAQTSETVQKLLTLTGDWGKFKGDKDAKSTVKPQAPKASAEERIKAAADQAEKVKQEKAKKLEEEKRAKEEAEKAAAEAALKEAQDAAAATETPAAESSEEEAPAENTETETPAETPAE